MTSVKKVLLPIQLSNQPNQIDHLMDDAGIGTLDEIHLLYVAPAILHLSKFSFPSSFRNRLESKVVQQAEKSLTEFSKKLSKIRDLKFAVAIGDPAKQIIKYAQTANIDLIIMIDYKKKYVAKLFLGSVVEQVIKISPAPVKVIMQN